MEKIYEKMMKKCFALAKRGRGRTLPNPLVGCVVTDENFNIISTGFHKKCGENHAERDALLKIDRTEGGILFVNLEPCSHFGKTPPCADLIIEKGIKKVVCATGDPNPLVKGRGFKKLEKAGIEVVSGVLEDEAKELNKVFLKNIVQKKPYIMIKTAITLDSKTALANGNSKWITDDFSRAEVMKMRSEYCAIMTGSGTVLADNPSLTARGKGFKNPIRIIMDREGKIPFDYKVFHDNTRKIYVVTNKNIRYPSYIEKIPFESLDGLFKELYQRKIYSIMVEAGEGLNSSIIKAKEADEINVFVAPKIFGGGKNFVSGFNFEEVDDCVKLNGLTVKKLKNDVLLNAKFLYD